MKHIATRSRDNEPRGWKPAWNHRELNRVLAGEVGRPHLRQDNPIFAGNLEGITQALYDVYFVAATQAAAPKLTLFANPVGSVYAFGGYTAFNKTYNHTNLSQAGMLEAPNKQIIRAISVYISGGQGIGPNLHPQDLGNMLMTYFQFNVNRKTYQDMIIGRLPAGGGPSITGTSNLTAGAANVAANVSGSNGWPVRDNTYALAYGGVPLEQAQNFNAIIDPTAGAGGAWGTANAAAATAGNGGQAGNGISAWVLFDGTLFRAVQ